MRHLIGGKAKLNMGACLMVREDLRVSRNTSAFYYIEDNCLKTLSTVRNIPI